MKYLIITLFIIYVLIKELKYLHTIQQNNYNDKNKYIKWIMHSDLFKTFDEKIVCLLIIISCLFSFIFKNINNMTYEIIFIIIYFILIVISNKIRQNSKLRAKKPLVFTARIKRLIFTLLIIYICLTIFAYKFNTFLLISVFSILIKYITFLANLINKPIEKYVFYSFKRKALNKLSSINPIVIGITGSYGKTSSKNILNTIISEKYTTLPSPKNYNTPYGLIRTINENMSKFDEVFIAEMGACKLGEIKELCDLVKPKYGILTTIGTAHLETFLSEENIQKTKFELIESLPEDGICVLNMDDEKQASYKLNNKIKCLWVSINNKGSDFKASNIKMNEKGTTFDIIFNSINESHNFTTGLLGYHNIYNILSGVALGYELGIDISTLIKAVKKVSAVEHRLELKKYNDITIIDDAYNSNPVGSEMALNVLKMMPGKRIVITPGMIELGDKEYELNEHFGKLMLDTCDEVILIGKEKTKPILSGLEKVEFDSEKIHILNDVKSAFKLIQKLKDKNTFVLLENDLPDIFNE